MPAVNADTLTLPRLPEPAAGAVERPVAGVTAAPSGFEGEGFPVRRAFAGVALEATHLLATLRTPQMNEIVVAPPGQQLAVGREDERSNLLVRHRPALQLPPFGDIPDSDHAINPGDNRLADA